MKTGHDKIINYLKSIKKRRKYIYLVNDHLIHEIIWNYLDYLDYS